MSVLNLEHGNENLGIVRGLLDHQIGERDGTEYDPQAWGFNVYSGSDDLAVCYTNQITELLAKYDLLIWPRPGRTYVWIAALTQRLLEFHGGTQIRVGSRIRGPQTLGVIRFKKGHKLNEDQIEPSMARHTLMRMVVKATQDLEYRKALAAFLTLRCSHRSGLPDLKAGFQIPRGKIT